MNKKYEHTYLPEMPSQLSLAAGHNIMQVLKEHREYRHGSQQIQVGEFLLCVVMRFHEVYDTVRRRRKTKDLDGIAGGVNTVTMPLGSRPAFRIPDWEEEWSFRVFMQIL